MVALGREQKQGFSPRHEEIIRPDGSVERVVPTPAINYEVVRTDTGKIAENLSEGEKNFIAFLYFQQLVFGRESADGDTREKIVVIDDPVSSMDSSALFIVSAQIRKMIEVCRGSNLFPNGIQIYGGEDPGHYKKVPSFAADPDDLYLYKILLEGVFLPD